MCYKTNMPIYEYSCEKCGKTFEVIQKLSDKPLKTHPGCGGRVTKLISAAGFQFKGTGWYVTDYARKGQAAESSDTGKDGQADKTPAKEKTGDDKQTATAEKPGKPEKSHKSEGKPKKS